MNFTGSINNAVIYVALSLVLLMQFHYGFCAPAPSAKFTMKNRHGLPQILLPFINHREMKPTLPEQIGSEDEDASGHGHKRPSESRFSEVSVGDPLRKRQVDTPATTTIPIPQFDFAMFEYALQIYQNLGPSELHRLMNNKPPAKRSNLPTFLST